MTRANPLLQILTKQALNIIHRYGDSGAYLLILQLSTSMDLKITGNNFRLQAGWYAYVGSARRYLLARVTRHLRANYLKNTAEHWHIDQLTLSENTLIQGIGLYPGQHECVISRKLGNRKDTSTPIPGFGASDCSAGCTAHLYRLHGTDIYQKILVMI